jgi:hypothetical protein
MSCAFCPAALIACCVMGGGVAAADRGSALPGYESVAWWRFGTEETSKLESHEAAGGGGVHRDQAGPQPPEFPDFEADNTAVRLDGRGAHFRFPDPGDGSPLDFANGDSLTLEAWVNLADIRSGENVYVVGKGRTHAPGFPRDNQNWALRLREVRGTARVSFLFRSAAGTHKGDGAAGDWHRWTSAEGIAAGSWHHVAVSYTFGNPDTLRGWLDGKRVRGDWDMGGATKSPPVVDNDAVWIGSSQGGNPGNSFRGLLDEIAIHRGIVPDETLRSRYRRVAVAIAASKATREAPADVLWPPPALRPSTVQVSVHENLATHESWPSEPRPAGSPVMQWETDLALFPRLPHRYDAWGIRDAWKPTVLLRAATQLDLPGGKHRLLIRSRGGGRLWLDGQVVARTPFHKREEGGYEPVAAVPQPPAPGGRPVGFGDHEAVVEVRLEAGRHTFVFESLVGGKKYRPETGECCAAVQLAGEKQFRVLGGSTAPSGSGTPSSTETPVWLTDAGWEAAAAQQERQLTTLDDLHRRAVAASEQAFWDRRHAHARRWAQAHPPPAVPEVAPSWPAHNEIDRFLAAKMERALAAAAPNSQAAEFHDTILPILRDNCFRCHGDKTSGGLRLASRDAAVAEGDSGAAAIVPGKPAKSNLIQRIKAPPEERMPPGGGLRPTQIAVLEQWIKSGAVWPDPPARPEEVATTPLTSDAAFLRRVYLDTVGVPPTSTEVRRFLADRSLDKRVILIDRLLADPRWADHWVSYWQDVLAENPSILKPTLNNTGPFRFFLHEALRDDRPFDRFVTELVLMRGSAPEGGSAGFGLAADNDVPLAAKAHVLGTAFLGVELQCARCHDAPYHATTQRDLFRLAAMLDRKPLTLPPTSTVPPAFFENKGRPSLIKASLKRGERIEATWPFAAVASGEIPPSLVHSASDSRERLAAILTTPENTRFAQVVVNRLWKRLLGAGLVEPVHDWEGRAASHPELLRWLAHDLVAHDYQLKHVARLILNSHAYQRQPRPVAANAMASAVNATAPPERRYFAAPDRRRLTAEQIVDSLFAAADKAMDVEVLTFDGDGRQPPDRFLNLGAPRRAWEFASLSNERDRPSLALPRAQAVVDVLEAFGWTGARQNPRTDRETEPNVLQPGILANGTLTLSISRLSERSGLTDAALRASSPDALAEELYLRFLTRLPTDDERSRLAALLSPGFAERRNETAAESPQRPLLPGVSWAHHLRPEATQVKFEYERQARAGDPPSPRLQSTWRARAEDAVWVTFNLPEFVWVP